ncbi:hypothetical protein [Natronogracilivirga saccharolytica]|uniref:Uncharacterized protein n=1 Tax=Natronogracilivirga saccharolytica TaxID=2812953 RepID=A0A8J7RIC1_9BACT|nr:hypothetical protein [Natronogracilivirga saccharolytica]MBP3191782.1 hypothetical protein [Natronogracilivirga saccharolytica]
MKTSFAFFITLIFVLSGFSYAQADMIPGKISDTQSIKKGMANEQTPGFSGQRGMRPSADNRLIMQLDDITDEQREHINELHESHRAEMQQLISKMRKEDIDREEYTSRRRELYRGHQQDLRKILSEKQWEQLQTLRSERRPERRSERGYRQSSYQPDRSPVIIPDLDRNGESAGEQASATELHQEMTEEARIWNQRRFFGRINPKDIQRNIFKAHLDCQVQPHGITG